MILIALMALFNTFQDTLYPIESNIFQLASQGFWTKLWEGGGNNPQYQMVGGHTRVPHLLTSMQYSIL